MKSNKIAETGEHRRQKKLKQTHKNNNSIKRTKAGKPQDHDKRTLTSGPITVLKADF